MSEDVAVLVGKYVKAAQAHAREKLKDARAANLEHDRVVQAFHQLEALGEEGWSAMRGLASHEDPEVRTWAATHLLRVDPEMACRVLEDLSTEPGFVGFEAGIVLTEWRAGRLRLA